jgi:ABC-type Fe3+-hydroxamate transport system substrate-binding protein
MSKRQQSSFEPGHRGLPIRLGEVPPRVVSLCPSITETLVSIGGLPHLVAATRYCVRPKGMLWGLPRIGGTKSPDIGRILDLKPDLVFANEEENRREDVEKLKEQGVAVDVTFPRKVADVPPTIRGWGRRLGGESMAQAEALASRVEKELSLLESETRASRFPFAYWIWRDPWMTVSDDTYVADLLRLGGGSNVFGSEAARYPTASPQQAVARGARAHFFPSEPYPFRPEKHEALARRLFGVEGTFFFVPGDDYCWHGARTLDGLARIRELKCLRDL